MATKHRIRINFRYLLNIKRYKPLLCDWVTFGWQTRSFLPSKSFTSAEKRKHSSAKIVRHFTGRFLIRMSKQSETRAFPLSSPLGKNIKKDDNGALRQGLQPLFPCFEKSWIIPAFPSSWIVRGKLPVKSTDCFIHSRGVLHQLDNSDLGKRKVVPRKV